MAAMKSTTTGDMMLVGDCTTDTWGVSSERRPTRRQLEREEESDEARVRCLTMASFEGASSQLPANRWSRRPLGSLGRRSPSAPRAAHRDIAWPERFGGGPSALPARVNRIACNPRHFGPNVHTHFFDLPHHTGRTDRHRLHSTQPTTKHDPPTRS